MNVGESQQQVLRCAQDDNVNQIERRRDPVARARHERRRIERRLREIRKMVPYASFESRNGMIAEMEAMAGEIDRLHSLLPAEQKTA